MPTENNPGVLTATSQPGMMSALGSVPDFGIVPDQVTVTGGISDGGINPYSTAFDAGAGIPSGLQNLDFSNIGDTISTPDFNFGTGSGSGGSLLSSAINMLTGGGGLGNLAAIGGEAAAAAYGLSEAKAAQKQSQQQAQQILDASQPFLKASQGLLGQFQSGTLTPQQQSYVDFATKEGQDIIDSGQGLKTIANQQLGAFASGKLLPADQIKLDQQTTTAKQQLLQKMQASGTVDSSIAAGYMQQIDNNALITQQQMLNQYYTTGNNAYNSWLNSTTQGAALKTAGAQFAQTSFQDMMQNALGLAGVGMSGLTQAIGLEIQSDNELSQTVGNLMASLASAFAYTVAGGAGGAGGGAGAGGGGAGGGLLGTLMSVGKTGSQLYKAASGLFSGGGSAAGSVSSILAGGAPAMQAVGVDSVSELGSVSDALGGFSSAGGAAAAGGAAGGAVGSAGAAALEASGSFATGGGAAAASGASSAGGASLGAAGTAAVVAAPFIFQQAGLALGDAWTAKNSQGNVAMKGWMQSTGAKWVPNKGQSNSGSTFQSQQFSNANNPGTMYDASGKPMNPADVSRAIHDWAVSNGVNPGDFH